MKNDKTTKISIVIPCFNEEAVLNLLHEKVTEVLLRQRFDYEVICVNDGSQDATWKVLKEIFQVDSKWRGINLSRNFGHQAAVSAGLRYTKGNCVVVIDADLQDPPEVILDFLKHWEDGYNVVYGVRKKRKDPIGKRILAWGFYRLIRRLVSLDIPPDSGDFCLMDRKVVDVMNNLPERSRYLRGLRVWCGFQHIGVPFEREARAAGQPQYTFKKSLKLALDGIYSFSAVPLAVASHLGLWVSGLALLGMVFTLAQRIFSDFFSTLGLAPGPGFATIVISILFLGGVQLICLGIIGEYLGRIYDEVKGRPGWIVSDLHSFTDNDRSNT
jgi:dolichol-phosphate mannosyltransferase